MKALFCLLLLFSMIACSSASKKTAEEIANENLLKEDQMIGPELPTWIKEDGVQGSLIVKVGKYEGDASVFREDALEELAFADGRSKLVSKMPIDFNLIVQKSMNSTGDMSYSRVETGLGQLLGVNGFETSPEYNTCRKMLRQTKYGPKVSRICWSRVVIPVENLNDAIAETIRTIYGRDKADKFKKIMDKNLEDFMKRSSKPVAITTTQNEKNDNQ
jgi:hypothetical protein